MNVLEVIRKAGRRFGDSSNVLILEQDFLDFINDAQLAIARETNCFTSVATVGASAFPWTIAANLIRINRILYDGVPIPKIEIESIDALGINVSNYEGGPTFFYIDNGTVVLYPAPSSTDTTNLTIEFTTTPTQITTTANPLTVPLSNHEDIVTFVLMRCHEMNQNYRAQEIAYNDFRHNIGIRVEEAQVKDDTYPIIRDDPADTGYYDASVW